MTESRPSAAPEAVNAHQTAAMPDVMMKVFQGLTAEYEATEISVPDFDDGILRLCSHMREPEPVPEPVPEAEAEL